MTNTTTAKRTRRSFVQLLADYKEALAAFDASVERRRSKLVARIEKLESRNAVMALGVETVGEQTPQEALDRLEAQIKDLKQRRQAVRKVAKSA